MTAKPVILTANTKRDARAAATYYRTEGGRALQVRFNDAYEACIKRIGETPQIGSLRYAQDTETPGVRMRAIDGFPYLMFYEEHETFVRVLRVLHSQRDIPAILGD